jgi:hypothetical protein
MQRDMDSQVMRDVLPAQGDLLVVGQNMTLAKQTCGSSPTLWFCDVFHIVWSSNLIA